MTGLMQRIFRRPPVRPRVGGDQTQLPAGQDPQETPGSAGPSFRERGRLRRRLRYLRRARELGYRDLGGLLFDTRRFGRERPDLVDAKLDALGALDRELRALEVMLDDRRPLHELREPGISSCARCGALHSSEANFCPHCGLSLAGPRAMGEVGGAIAAPPQAPAPPGGPPPSTAPRPGAPSDEHPAGPHADGPVEPPTEALTPRPGSDRGS